MNDKSKKNLLPETRKLFILFTDSEHYYNKEYNNIEVSKEDEEKNKQIIANKIKTMKNSITKNNIDIEIEIVNDMIKYKTENILEEDLIDVKKQAILLYKNQTKMCITTKSNHDYESGVDAEYVENSIETANAIITLNTNNDDNSEIIGFSTLLLDIENNNIYVDVLCSSDNYYGGGTLIIDKIKLLAKHGGGTRVNIPHSIGDSVDFYTKNGFQIESCALTYKTNVRGGSGSGNMRKKSKKRKTRTICKNRKKTHRCKKRYTLYTQKRRK